MVDRKMIGGFVNYLARQTDGLSKTCSSGVGKVCFFANPSNIDKVYDRAKKLGVVDKAPRHLAAALFDEFIFEEKQV